MRHNRGMDILSPKELEAVEAGHQLIDNDWEDMCAQIPVDVEGLAQETKALQRKREVKSVPDLLRLVLAYSMCDWSLRVVGAWARIIGLGNLSDVAVYKRLCGSLTWLGRIIGAWLEKRQEQLAGRSARVRLIDATVISKDLFKNNFVLLQPNHGDAKRGLMT